jgi:hypothetical protein
LNFNSIQVVHAMPVNIFIGMELSFHKIDSFLHQLISWLSPVVDISVEPK